MRTLTKKEIRNFQETVYTHFKKCGRDLPWRATANPYRILVSEVMLQQTQVERVVGKYNEFLKVFPSVNKLAAASLKDVLVVWQGMGYNRRAKFLHEAAKVMVLQHKGKVPKKIEELEALPGIGPATARSIAAFAYDTPVSFIETNVRSVIIHHFFTGKEKVNDKDVLCCVEQTLDKQNPRRWYNALMDYGTHIKKTHKNPSRKSKHHIKQAPFEGSDRQVRGAVLRLLTQQKTSRESLAAQLPVDNSRLSRILTDLEKEGFIYLKKKQVELV